MLAPHSANSLESATARAQLTMGRFYVASFRTQHEGLDIGGCGMISQGRAMSAMKEDTSMEGVAGAALWLCSDLGLSTTGEVIHVDAGFHMMGMAADEEG